MFDPLIDDAGLVAHVLAGDPIAADLLYRRHVHAITRLVARLVRHGPDIEDIVQDVFAEGLRGLHRLRAPSSFGLWLRTSAVHRCHKHFRRRHLQRVLGLHRSLDHDEPLAAQVHSEAGQEARAELALVDACLDTMRAEDSVAWVLRHLEGHELAEVAALTSASVATVKRRLTRAQTVLDTQRRAR